MASKIIWSFRGTCEASDMGWAPGLAERLARERDILALLEHPNIARLR